MSGQPLERSERDAATLRDRKALLGAVVFCRHGTTDYDANRFYEAGDGPVLNEDGLAQAEALGRWFSRGPVSAEALYVSPTARTRQTAGAIERALGLKAVLSPSLVERSVGQWNGQLVGDIKLADAQSWNAWKSDPLRFAPPGGESLEAFGGRVEAGVADLIARHPGKVIIVVTHVGTIRAVLCRALGCALDHGKRFVIEPGSLTRVDYTTSWPNLVFMGVQPN